MPYLLGQQRIRAYGSYNSKNNSFMLSTINNGSCWIPRQARCQAPCGIQWNWYDETENPTGQTWSEELYKSLVQERQAKIKNTDNKRITGTVRVSSSEYQMNKASGLSTQNIIFNRHQPKPVYDRDDLKLHQWNQSSDRALPSRFNRKLNVNVPSHGNSTKTSLTRHRPGAGAGGKQLGVDLKHNSYHRYLLKKKGLKPLRGEKQKIDPWKDPKPHQSKAVFDKSVQNNKWRKDSIVANMNLCSKDPEDCSYTPASVIVMQQFLKAIKDILCDPDGLFSFCTGNSYADIEQFLGGNKWNLYDDDVTTKELFAEKYKRILSLSGATVEQLMRFFVLEFDVDTDSFTDTEFNDINKKFIGGVYNITSTYQSIGVPDGTFNVTVSSEGFGSKKFIINDDTTNSFQLDPDEIYWFDLSDPSNRDSDMTLQLEFRQTSPTSSNFYIGVLVGNPGYEGSGIALAFPYDDNAPQGFIRLRTANQIYQEVHNPGSLYSESQIVVQLSIDNKEMSKEPEKESSFFNLDPFDYTVNTDKIVERKEYPHSEISLLIADKKDIEYFCKTYDPKITYLDIDNNKVTLDLKDIGDGKLVKIRKPTEINFSSKLASFNAKWDDEWKVNPPIAVTKDNMLIFDKLQNLTLVVANNN